MATQTAYIVQRIDWGYDDEWFYPDGDTPIKAFGSWERAEHHRREQETIQRRALQESSDNFWGKNLTWTFGSLEEISSLSEAEFKDRLRTLDIPQPEHLMDDEAWWNTVWEKMTQEQEEAFWQLFDRLHFFTVVEVELD